MQNDELHCILKAHTGTVSSPKMADKKKPSGLSARRACTIVPGKSLAQCKPRHAITRSNDCSGTCSSKCSCWACTSVLVLVYCANRLSAIECAFCSREFAESRCVMCSMPLVPGARCAATTSWHPPSRSTLVKCFWQSSTRSTIRSATLLSTGSSSLSMLCCSPAFSLCGSTSA